MTTNSLYRSILRQALFVTKKYKYLWFLGFLVAFLGNNGELELILNQFNKLSSGALQVSDSIISSFGAGGNNIIKLILNQFALTHHNFVLIILFGAILFIFIWLSVSAQGAIIRAIAIAGGMDKVNLREHFSKGSNSFFSLLGIILATRFGAFFIIAVVGLPLASILIYFLDPWIVSSLVIFVVGLPLLIIASLISKYAIAYHMLDRKSWKLSISSALQLFADNWLISIELAVILFVVSVLAGAIIMLLILLFSIPFIFLTYILQNNYESYAIIILWIGQIIAFAFLLLFGSILATFQYACWTELFLKIRKYKHLSKIMRVIMSVREKYR